MPSRIEDWISDLSRLSAVFSRMKSSYAPMIGALRLMMVGWVRAISKMRFWFGRSVIEAST